MVSSCLLTGNTIGLYSYEGLTTVSDCVVIGNGEAGLFNTGHFGPNDSITGHGSMTISDSIISDNSGPGVWNYFSLTIVNSTLSGNTAGDGLDGGGIRSGTIKAPGGVTVINSTISGNSAGEVGGGIANYTGGAQVSNSTVSGNSATSGGGIYNDGTIEISNTILNAGAFGENVVNDGGTVTSHGYNISSDDGGGVLTGPGDQINTDPLLGPLRDHGGPTLTHVPMRGSPAIEAGDPSFTLPPDHDQRGAYYYRVFGPRIDVGSVETQPQPRCVTPAPRPHP